MKFKLLFVICFVLLLCADVRLVFAFDTDEEFYYPETIAAADRSMLEKVENLLRDCKFSKAKSMLDMIFSDEDRYGKDVLAMSTFLMGDLYFYWEVGREFPYKDESLRWYGNAVVESGKSRNVPRALYNMSNVHKIQDNALNEEATLKRLIGLDEKSSYYIKGALRLAEMMEERRDFIKAKKVYLEMLRSSVIKGTVGGEIFQKVSYLIADLYRKEMGCKAWLKKFTKVYRKFFDFLADNRDLIETSLPCLLDEKSYALIEEIISSYMRKHPSDRNASVIYLKIMGDAYRGMRKYEKAKEQYLRSALFHKSSEHTYASEIGIVDAEQQDIINRRTKKSRKNEQEYREALMKSVMVYQSVIMRSPFVENRLEALFKLGKVSEDMGNWHNFYKMMAYIVDNYTGSRWVERAVLSRNKAFDLYAAYLYESGDYETIMEIYSSLWDVDPADLDIKTHIIVADVYKNKKLYPLAVEVYSRLRKGEEYSERVRFLLGEAFLLNEQYEESVLVLKDKIKRGNRYYFSTLKTLAGSYFRMGNYADAKLYYGKLFSGKQNLSFVNDSDRYNYAFSLQMAGDVNRAQNMYASLIVKIIGEGDNEVMEAINRDKQQLEELYYNYLAVLYKSGDCRQYITKLGKYRQYVPGDSDLYLKFQEGHCLLELGEVQPAIALLKEVSRSGSFLGKMADVEINLKTVNDT